MTAGQHHAKPINRAERRDTRTILVSGATGFIGTRLVRRLLAGGDEVIVWARNADKALDLFGPRLRIITNLGDIESNQRIDTIINLAGEPVAAWPWTRARKRALIDSRVETTAALRRLIARLSTKPASMLNASAVGYYGVDETDPHDTDPVGENGLPGAGFQSELCVHWETQARRVENYGVRVIRARFGVVFGPDGGAFPALVRPVRYGLGAVLGNGAQPMSWIHIEDLLNLVTFALDADTLEGAINFTAPEPVTQATFAHAVGERLHRRVRLRIPAWLIRLVGGEMAELLVDGQQVVPVKSLAEGFEFRFPTLISALNDLLRTDVAAAPAMPAKAGMTSLMERRQGPV